MNKAPLKILLVEDSPSDAALLLESLTQNRLERFEFTHAGSWAEAVKNLQRGHFDVLLLDLSLPDSTGPDTFLRARAECPHVPIVVLTGVEDDRIGLEAVRHGIQDYLVKGQTDGHLIARAIRYAIERKQAEEAIRQLNADLESRVQARTAEAREKSRFLDAFFQHAIDPLVFLDQQFNFIRVNEAYARACRRAVSEFSGRNHFELYPHAENQVIFESVVRTRTPYVAAAKPFVFPDHPEWGVTYWDWTLVPVLDSKGGVDFLVFSLRDVTQRKQAEEEVRARSLYARSLIEASLDPLVTISGDGKISDVNKAGELITGLSREQLIGSNFPIFATEPDKAKEGFRRVMQEGQLRDYPLTIRHASGRTTDVVFNASIYRNMAGQVQGVFASARDITERKRMEGAHLDLLRRLADAEETERGRISRELHDRLGQDLTGLKLGLLYIRKQGPFTPPVQASIGRLEQLTDGLMRDVHRLAWELHPAALDDLGLEAVLRQFTAEWSENHKVPVDFLSDGVEAKRLPLQLETTLYRVAQEALTNVIRHANAKRVSVLLERRPDHVSLIIEDDGEGFAVVNQTPTAQGKLGLLGMRERVTLAGGTLEIESAPGAGTTVFVRVPFKHGPVKSSRP